MEETKPTHRKHCRWHNYSERCIYHITMVVRGRASILGHLTEAVEGKQATICPWNREAKAWMNLTPLGMDVADCIRNIPEFARKKGLNVRVLAQQVMDTHVHFVLYVQEDMGDTVLGDLIRGLKVGCNRAYRRRAESEEPGTVCQAVGQGQTTGNIAGEKKGVGLFEADYDETILRRKGQLQRMIDYVHENPYRKWVKIHHKETFIPVRGIEIAGKRYDAIGNLMLLGLRRFQVHCRYKWELHHDTDARRAHQNECVLKARQNYALVSPYIMQHEADVRDVCLREGHSIIQIVDNGFSDYATCPGGLFEYCEKGQVLLLVPSEFPHIERKSRIERAECVYLNGRAEEIVGEWE